MAITETSRHRLHTTLEDVFGQENAATLMEHLPPTGWADVATKRDLDQLREVVELRFDHAKETLDLRFAEVDARLDQMVTEGDFHRTLRKHALGLIGTNLLLWATFAGVVR